MIFARPYVYLYLVALLQADALLLPETAQAAPTPKLPTDIVLSNQEWPPYLGEKLPYGGILSRLVQEAFAKKGIHVHYRFYPNNRALTLARTGSVDGSLGWAPSDSRRKDLLYSKPVLSANMMLLQHAGPAIRWQKLADLSSYSIGITIGNYYGPDFDLPGHSKKLKLEPVGDDVTNLRKLLAKRIDMFPIDKEVGNYLIHQNFSAKELRQFSISGQTFWSAPLHMVIWRANPQGQELVEIFNQGLTELQKSGEFDRLVRQTRTACLADLH